MVRSAATPRVLNHEATDAQSSFRAKDSLPRPKLFDLGIAWKVIRPLAIDGVHHDALAVLQRGLADEGAERGLVVDLAEGDLAERRRHRKPLGGCDQFLRVGRAGLCKYRSGGLDGLIADDRAQSRIVIIFGLISPE